MGGAALATVLAIAGSRTRLAPTRRREYRALQWGPHRVTPKRAGNRVPALALSNGTLRTRSHAIDNLPGHRSVRIVRGRGVEQVFVGLPGCGSRGETEFDTVVTVRATQPTVGL